MILPVIRIINKKIRNQETEVMPIQQFTITQ